MKNKLLIIVLVLASLAAAGSVWRMFDPSRFGPDPIPSGPNILVP